MQAPFFDIAELQDLILRLAPELQTIPLYITLSSRLPGSFRSPVFGYTHSDIDLVLREHVDWLGRGIGMVINDTEILAWAAAGDQKQNAHARLCFLGIGLHEAAHNLPVAAKFEVASNSPEITVACEMIEKANRTEFQNEQVPWKQLLSHRAWFYRVAAHLFFRAFDFGLELDPAMIDGELWLFLNQLETEAMAMLNSSFEELSQLPLPPDFRRAWRGHLLVFALTHLKEVYDSDPQFLDKLEELISSNKPMASNHPAIGPFKGVPDSKSRRSENDKRKGKAA